MNLFLKKMGFTLALLLVLIPLSANDLLTIGAGDIGSFRLYDSQGNKREVTEEVTSQIGEGWIINNPETPILIETPQGIVNLFENAILIIGDVSSSNPQLYLVQGKATFHTNDTFKDTLVVSTPVSQFKLQGKGEILVITTDTEESVTSFGGNVIASNGISHAKTLVKPFGKLFMNDPHRLVSQIQDGYYLTYATYPDLMLAKQLVSDFSNTMIAPVPSAPKVSVMTQQVPKKPSKPGLTIMPMTASAPTMVSNTVQVETASAPQILSVVTKQQTIPKTPSKINTTLVPVAPKRIVVTVKPLEPQIIKSETTAMAVPAAESLVVSEVQTKKVSIPMAPVAKVSVVPLETAVEAIEIVEPDKQAPSSPVSVVKKPVTLSTTQQNTVVGSFGLKTIYDFTYDGTDGNAMSHTLTLYPYFSYKSIKVELQGNISTTDFATFSSSVPYSPSDTLETISYITSFISELRFGYNSSPFYLALDDSNHNDSDFSNLTAPIFGDTDKLGLYNKLTFSKVSFITTFDDLYLGQLLDDKSQYGSFTMLYSGNDNYPFQMSFGALVSIENDPTWAYDLYPTLSFKFPVINKRNLQMGLLANASGYLPVYPNFDITKLFDPTSATIFPNFLINAGFVLQAGPFFAETLFSVEEGQNQSMLVNDFSYEYGLASLTNDAIFNIFANLGWESDAFSTEVVWNIPFKSDFTVATLTSNARMADLSQISASYSGKNIELSLGLQQIGIIESVSDVANGTDTILSLFGGEYASAFLQASYKFGFAQLKARAVYPVGSTSYTVPKLTLSAIIDIGKKY
jgi:hypothetical protein